MTRFNPLPYDKCSSLSKLKAFTDNKLIVTQNLKFVLHSVENIVGKGENAGYHFLFFPQCFHIGLLPQGYQKVKSCLSSAH